MLYEEACKELKLLTKHISHLDNQLQKLPEGKLYCSRDGETFKWYHHTAEKAFQKLQLYSNHGIYPTINLITTYETKEYPLTLDTIEKVVEDYFK